MGDDAKVGIFISSLVFMFLVIVVIGIQRGHAAELKLKEQCIAAEIPVLECNELVGGK